MYNNEHLQLNSQRKNAIELLKQWEMKPNLNNELEKNTNLTNIGAKFDESNVCNVRLISNKEHKP